MTFFSCALLTWHKLIITRSLIRQHQVPVELSARVAAVGAVEEGRQDRVQQVPTFCRNDIPRVLASPHEPGAEQAEHREEQDSHTHLTPDGRQRHCSHQ